MSAAIQPTVKGIDVNAQILSRLDELNVSHAEKRADCFAKDLPFYTCIDSLKDFWTKELGNGRIFLVKRSFDFDRDVPVDALVRELR